MPPAKKDLILYKGDSFQLYVRIRSKIVNETSMQLVTGPGKNLDGMTVKACIRTVAGAAEVLAEFDAIIPDQDVEANLGFILLTLSPAQTSRLPSSAGFPNPNLVYDVKVQEKGDDPQFAKTYLRGSIAVQENIS